MASDVANGSTITFGSAIDDVTNIGFSVNGNPVDLTDLSDVAMRYANGIPDIEVTCTVTGVSSIDTDTAASTLSISWNDGSTDTLEGNWICTARETSGGVNSAITTNLTFKPSA